MTLRKNVRRAGVAVAVAMLVTGTAARADEPVLTLADAVRVALSANPAVAASQAALAAAGFQADAAITGFLPQVTGAVSYRRATQNSGASPVNVTTAGGVVVPSTSRISGTSYDNYSASLGLQQTIWDFGRTLGPLDAAKAQGRAAAADLRATVEDTILQVGQAYFQAIAAGEAVQAAAESRRQMAEHLDAARGRVEVGVRPRIDETRALADLAQADLAQIQAVNAERSARIALGTAMGKPGLGVVTLVRPAASEPPGAEDLEASVREAMDNRPTVLRLREQVRAAEAQVVAARGGYFPTLAANAGLTYTGFKLPDLAWNWYAGASLTWGLVSNIVQANATTKGAQAGVQGLKANLQALENGLRAEVENAEVAWREAKDKQAPARALLAAAKETAELAEARYAAGTGNVTEVADAQATLVSARTAVIQAELALEVARLNLLHSLGRLGSSFQASAAP